MDVGLLLARAAERGAELGVRLVRIGADVVVWLGAGREAAGEAVAPEIGGLPREEPRLTQLQPGYCALVGTDTSGSQRVCASARERARARHTACT